ncbi:MAG: UDP-N-acetylglucosamine 1-carboxyvinyltransferase [Planctomycetes bacterium]|nr:UDP-N-acetylglucosamine 1-carboxyvinyltransferase [Planctomycetota bacterium]
MDAFRIQGGARLSGRIAIDGSKNASLPLMAAALLTDEPITLRRVPDLSDISSMIRLLGELGCHVEGKHGTVTITSMDPEKTHAHYDIVKTMRASICVLGPMLAKRKRAVVAMPGGCAFGARPVDLHLKGLEALGATIELKGGDIIATAQQLTGATIFLGGPFGSTVLGTANVMSAATLAKGTTTIESAACEPEIVDLANLLNSMGANIQGAGTPRLTIQGVDELRASDYTVMPDRIVAGTYAIASAITNGDVILDDFPYDCLLSLVELLQQIGVNVKRLHSEKHSRRCTVQITSERVLKPVMATTQPYPGFPTDLQAQLISLLCLAHGNSIITEKIYPERFMHVAELARMGAKLYRQGPTVMVQGVSKLIAAPVMASDLRGSACLVLAGLVAEGTTTVSRVYHLDRGYTRMEETLCALGAKIERFSLESAAAGISEQELVAQ